MEAVCLNAAEAPIRHGADTGKDWEKFFALARGLP